MTTSVSGMSLGALALEMGGLLGTCDRNNAAVADLVFSSV